MTHFPPTIEFPPLAALFLTHFDDLKGQSTVYYASLPDLPERLIEHESLPSGLHTLRSDLVVFTHHDLPAVGLFKSTITENQGRGRRMGTLGVIPANGTMTDLYELREPLEMLFDMINRDSEAIENDRNPLLEARTKRILGNVWWDFKAEGARRKDDVRAIRGIVNGVYNLQPLHPISHLPALLVLLGPLIITVYKYALAGKRILIYSPPPLLPLSALGWCIQAMSLPPPNTADAEISRWIGNVGLMDLDEVKKRTGGWVGTTSDKIYKSHTAAYDLFIDLSPPPSPSLQPPHTSVTSLTDPSSDPSLSTHASLHVPSTASGETTEITYSFSDIPLYRSLLLLQISPPSVTISSKLGVRGNMWVWAFELFERAWKLCKGVCEYALGQGDVGEVRLSEGEEDASLIDPLIMDETDEGDEGGSPRAMRRSRSEEYDDEGGLGREEDETIRVGRLLLRQFHHNSFHLSQRLRKVRRGTGGPLSETEVRELVGRSWRFGRLVDSDEGRWWGDLAKTWGIALDD